MDLQVTWHIAQRTNSGRKEELQIHSAFRKFSDHFTFSTIYISFMLHSRFIFQSICKKYYIIYQHNRKNKNLNICICAQELRPFSLILEIELWSILLCPVISICDPIYVDEGRWHFLTNLLSCPVRGRAGYWRGNWKHIMVEKKLSKTQMPWMKLHGDKRTPPAIPVARHQLGF